MPAAPWLRRTSCHALSNTSLRQTLSNSAWNRLVGSALAARYSACCKARVLSFPTVARVDLAETALTRPLPQPTHKRSSGPSLTAGCVVLRLDRYYDRLRLPPGARSTSRLHTGYRTGRSTQFAVRFGRGGPPQFPPSPSERSAPSYAEESFAAALPGSSPLPWPS